jgi:acyl-CoA dehydrogenase
VDRSYLDWPFFDNAHRDLARDIHGWADEHIEHHEDADVDAASRALVRKLAGDGWLQHAVSHTGAIEVRPLCLIREALAYRCGLADFAFAMQGLGSGPISLFGDEAQRAKYLDDVSAGKKIAAFALSEADAGSNVGAIATTARRDGDTYILNGEKTWISNAGIADFYVVFARTGEGPGTKGLSAFVVDADTRGVDAAQRIDVIAPHPLGKLRFADCRVERARLLGQPGQGFKVAMGTLDVFRSSVAAAALGFARRAMDEAVTRTTQRRVFDAQLAEFQMTQARVATMALDVDSIALLVYRAAWRKDSGARSVTREAAMAKWHATEAAQRVIDSAVQLFGGSGVVTGETVERLYRDIRPLRIYEGTTEIQQLIVARETYRAQDSNTSREKT